MQITSIAARNERLGPGGRTSGILRCRRHWPPYPEFITVMLFYPLECACVVQIQAIFDQAKIVAFDLSAFMTHEDVFLGIKGEMPFSAFVVTVWAVGNMVVATALQVITQAGGQVQYVDTGIESVSVDGVFRGVTHLCTSWKWVDMVELSGINPLFPQAATGGNISMRSNLKLPIISTISTIIERDRLQVDSLDEFTLGVTNLNGDTVQRLNIIFESTCK